MPNPAAVSLLAAVDCARKLSISSWTHPLRRSFSTTIIDPRKSKTPTGNPDKASAFRGGDTKRAKPTPPAPYMRETIAAVSRILRSHTWEDAQRQLRAFPIRWDSYTVNQVLKAHPPMEKAWLFFLWVSQVRGFKHDHFTYTTMLDIFGEAGRISSMESLFVEMEEKGVRVDAATYTSVMQWKAKAGDMEGAARAWEEMRRVGCEPTVVSYTALMKVLLDHGRPTEAAAVYREMIEMGLSPTCHSYTVLVEYLAGSGKFNAAVGIMDKMQDAGVQPDKAMCNILIQKCSKFGETTTMCQVLHYMKEHSLVLRLPIFLEALDTLRKSGESDHLLREVNPHFSSIGMEQEMSGSECVVYDINSCIDHGIVFNLLARQNFVAIDHIVKEMILQNMKLDPELISAIIRATCKNGRLSTALLAFQYSVKVGQKHERHAYLSLIGPLIRLNCLEEVLRVIEEMIKQGHRLGTYLVSLLVLRLGCAGMPAFANKLFNSLPDDQNTVTYTALIHAYLRSAEVDKGLDLFASMIKEGNRASLGTYEVLIFGLEEAGRDHEAKSFKKEKKKLQFHGSYDESLSMEERLCDCLFSGN